MNLAKELQYEVERDGEVIEAIVVGPHHRTPYGERPETYPLLPVAEGLALLDYEYDNGYGGADCRPFFAWTKSKVYFVEEYDGATDLAWVPRNPVAMEPHFNGAW